MVSCIVVDRFNMEKTKNMDTLKEMFQGDCLEIDRQENGMDLMYVYGVQKIKIWQAVLYLEADQIPVGFGFGIIKEVAKEEALDRLKIISEMEIP